MFLELKWLTHINDVYFILRWATLDFYTSAIYSHYKAVSLLRLPTCFPYYFLKMSFSIF